MTTPADVSGADVSGDENGNHTYQVSNPIMHTPHPITGVIYTDINPQRTKKGQKVSEEVENPTYNYNNTGVLLHMYSIAGFIQPYYTSCIDVRNVRI